MAGVFEQLMRRPPKRSVIRDRPFKSHHHYCTESRNETPLTYTAAFHPRTPGSPRCREEWLAFSSSSCDDHPHDLSSEMGHSSHTTIIVPRPGTKIRLLIQRLFIYVLLVAPGGTR
ncbi:hypothetical protein AVEN_75724-1 [Araneus ventricosus]|uniref:Uncharacterized protein n=1 Tax=Araneus ventricosus TaxID=182803 RepID=A0A4Y2K123_ARAVE|nr:hypothetical protein AVEN_75724-1 [Araneus ventricosus]